jgi:hypothetical protein
MARPRSLTVMAGLALPQVIVGILVGRATGLAADYSYPCWSPSQGTIGRAVPRRADRPGHHDLLPAHS